MKKIAYISLLFSVFLVLKRTDTSAQGICSTLPAGAVAGSFEIENNYEVICSGATIKLKNTSGGTAIKYDFNYASQSPTSLTLTGNNDSTHTYILPSNITRKFTILQYGEKAGKKIYACKEVTVRQNLKPKFTYTTCNLNFVNVIIPVDSLNDFDGFCIDWGDGNISPTILTLPNNSNHSYATYKTIQNIRIIGKYNKPVGCPSPPSETILMDAGGQIPKITRLQMLPDGKSVNLSFTGPAEKSQIYQREINGTYAYPNFEAEKTPGTYKFPLKGNNENCFMIYHNPGCVELSGEVCTIKIDSVFALSQFENTIDFGNPKFGGLQTIIKETNTSNIIVSLEVQETTGSNKTNYILPLNSSPFIHKILNCKNNFCYTLKAEYIGTWGTSPGTAFTYSAPFCINRANNKPPSPKDIILDQNDAGKISINFKNENTWPILKDKYYLYKSGIKVDSLNANSNPLKFERNADIATQCFKLSFLDQCNSLSEQSNVFCSVVLEEAGKTKVKWNADTPFSDNSIQSYNFYSFDEVSNTQNLIGNFPSTVNITDIDLSSFIDEAKFKIEILGNTGIKSNSNLLKIPIKADFYVPTGFTPNGNSINDEFKIQGRFGRVVNYKLQIFNKWGELLFNSEDKTETWNGMVNNKMANTGAYLCL